MINNAALLMIDIQNDFCPGGALAVENGDQVVRVANRLQEKFAVRVLTQDWHPSNHSSFAHNHPGAEPFSIIEMPYGPQVLWPVHCVIGSDGAQFHPYLDIYHADLIIRKGFRAEIDSYSAFYENDHKTPTGLTGYLRERDVDHVYMVGLATDFCVYYSAIDAVKLGFKVSLVTDGCRAIDLGGSLDKSMDDMRSQGVEFITSSDI